ncbi:hypothetical protein [Chryseobacterium indoltheticum]|uniref:hypothetical protein n=1 Tax=Chryseobacterium indoltheticum TaxID=254 RepID=UPI003F498D4A
MRKQFENIDLNSYPQTYEEVFEEVKTLYTQHAIAFHHPKYVAHLNCPSCNSGGCCRNVNKFY